jgi:MFS family permease
VIAGLLLLGPLSDSVGRRAPLVATLFLAAGASVLFALAQATAVLFAARVLQGLAVGIASGAAVAALVELEPGGDRGRAALAATLATVGGSALGPLLAGVLAEHVGGRSLPFVVHLGLLVPALVMMTLLTPSSGLRAALTGWRPRRPAFPLDARRFVAATMAATAGWAMSGLFLAVIPSYAALLLDSDDLALLGGVVFLMLAASCAAQVAARATPARRAMLAGLVALIAGAAMVALAFPTRSLAVLLAGSLIAGLGQGLTWLGATTTINAIAPHDRRAEVSSTYFAAIYLGVSLAVVGVGALATAISLEIAVYVFAAVVSAGALVTIAVVARPTDLTTA